MPLTKLNDGEVFGCYLWNTASVVSHTYSFALRVSLNAERCCAFLKNWIKISWKCWDWRRFACAKFNEHYLIVRLACLEGSADPIQAICTTYLLSHRESVETRLYAQSVNDMWVSWAVWNKWMNHRRREWLVLQNDSRFVTRCRAWLLKMISA